jgi:riboflavin synthase
MFTGLVSDVGEVTERKVTDAGGAFVIRCGYDPTTIAIGASISCDGCCLTAIVVTPRPDRGSLLVFDVSNETLGKTALGTWQPGRRINLERSLKAGDELGGHIVAGHVDGLARIVSIRPDGDSRRFTFEAPAPLHRMIAPKGSVALDGTSLTVNEVLDTTFGVNIIPHTLAVTTWGQRQAGEPVNLEVDVLARYVARLMETAR